jgi:hypothetical protein
MKAVTQSIEKAANFRGNILGFHESKHDSFGSQHNEATFISYNEPAYFVIVKLVWHWRWTGVPFVFRKDASQLLAVGIANRTLHMSRIEGFPSCFTSNQRPRTVYGSGQEAFAVNQEIGDFVATSSRAHDLIERHFGSSIRLTELKAVVRTAIAFVKYKQEIVLPKISRNAKRSRPLLVKYVDTHYAHLAPVFPILSLCDRYRKPIPILDAARSDPEERSI